MCVRMCACAHICRIKGGGKNIETNMVSVSAMLVHIYNFVVNKQQQRSSAELGLRIWSAMRAPPHTMRAPKDTQNEFIEICREWCEIGLGSPTIMAQIEINPSKAAICSVSWVDGMQLLCTRIPFAFHLNEFSCSFRIYLDAPLSMLLLWWC